MFDALSFAQIDAQHVELLPARTVLSLFSAGALRGSDTASGGQGVTGGTGGEGHGKAELFRNSFYTERDVIIYLIGANGGASSADSGAANAASSVPSAATGGTGVAGAGQPGQ
jgi:hypothetical protein